MNREKLGFNLLFATFIVFLILIIFVYRLDGNLIPIIDLPLIKDTLRFEIIKSLLQLLFVVIVGGVIAYLFKSREEERKNEQIRANIRIDYFKRLGSIYRNVKQVRRNLQAAGITTDNNSKPQIFITGSLTLIYLEQMQLIEKYQLELEELMIEASFLPDFAKIYKMEDDLKIMEVYLRKLLKEYEEYCPKLNNKEEVDLSKLERLDEFTGNPYREFQFTQKVDNINKDIKSPFKAVFSGSYKIIIEKISKQLYH